MAPQSFDLLRSGIWDPRGNRGNDFRLVRGTGKLHSELQEKGQQQKAAEEQYAVTLQQHENLGRQLEVKLAEKEGLISELEGAVKEKEARSQKFEGEVQRLLQEIENSQKRISQSSDANNSLRQQLDDVTQKAQQDIQAKDVLIGEVEEKVRKMEESSTL